MATNDFLPWATAGGANVLSQADYASEPARLVGVVSGLGRSILANKSWRQSASMAALLGRFITEVGGLDALDNGNIDALLANFIATFRAQKPNYVSLVSGTANALAINLNPAPADNAALIGTPLRILIVAVNTGATTLSVNGLAALPIQRFDGQPLQRGDLPPGSIATLIPTGTAFRLTGIIYSEFRRRLSANLILWVRTDGNDNNDGSANTAGAAMATIQGAYDRATRLYDTAGFSITIKLGNIGAYLGATLAGFSGTIIVEGDLANPQNYTIIGQATTDTCIVASTNSLTLRGLTFNPPLLLGGPSNCVFARSGSVVNLRNVNFKPAYYLAAHSHIGIEAGASVYTFGSIGIQTAGGDSFINVSAGGSYQGGFAGDPTTITVSNAPAWNTAFCRVVNGAASFGATTISGSATGKRYDASLNGVINTFGGGANFLPGNAAGTTASGGQYA